MPRRTKSSLTPWTPTIHADTLVWNRSEATATLADLRLDGFPEYVDLVRPSLNGGPVALTRTGGKLGPGGMPIAALYESPSGAVKLTINR